MIYSILILTLFLIVQILFTFQSRKNILDWEKNQLLDTVNKANEVYDLEKITNLLEEQQKKIEELQNLVTSIKDSMYAKEQVNEMVNGSVKEYVQVINLTSGWFGKSSSQNNRCGK